MIHQIHLGNKQVSTSDHLSKVAVHSSTWAFTVINLVVSMAKIIQQPLSWLHKSDFHSRNRLCGSPFGILSHFGADTFSLEPHIHSVLLTRSPEYRWEFSAFSDLLILLGHQVAFVSHIFPWNITARAKFSLALEKGLILLRLFVKV